MAIWLFSRWERKTAPQVAGSIGPPPLWMDVSHDAVTKEFGKTSAVFTLAVSIGLTLVLGAKLFGLY